MKTFLSLVLLFVTTGLVWGQTEAQRKTQYNVKKNLALEGYDAVSYFDGKPVEGDEDIKFTYKGLVYLFATQRNLDKFKASPARYEPAYGGWCAYAMGETGEKVKVDPETYKILEGKLYLFYNFWGNNTLKDWDKDEKKLKDAGDRNWWKFVQ